MQLICIVSGVFFVVMSGFFCVLCVLIEFFSIGRWNVLIWKLLLQQVVFGVFFGLFLSLMLYLLSFVVVGSVNCEFVLWLVVYVSGSLQVWFVLRWWIVMCVGYCDGNVRFCSVLVWMKCFIDMVLLVCSNVWLNIVCVCMVGVLLVLVGMLKCYDLILWFQFELMNVMLGFVFGLLMCVDMKQLLKCCFDELYVCFGLNGLLIFSRFCVLVLLVVILLLLQFDMWICVFGIGLFLLSVVIYMRLFLWFCFRCMLRFVMSMVVCMYMFDGFVSSEWLSVGDVSLSMQKLGLLIGMLIILNGCSVFGLVFGSVSICVLGLFVSSDSECMLMWWFFGVGCFLLVLSGMYMGCWFLCCSRLGIWLLIELVVIDQLLN